MNLIPLPHGKLAYILDDDEIARRFWRSAWGAIAQAECRPDAERRNRDPLLSNLINAFFGAPLVCGGLHSVYALDDFIGAQKMRAVIMAHWPQEVTT